MTSETPENNAVMQPEGAATPEEHSSLAGKEDHKEYAIDIYRAWCKACGICVAFCPRECLGLNENGAPVVLKPERCTGCGWCELHCPDFAISVHERPRPAVEGEAD